MKFVMYNDNQPGILTDAGVIDIGDLCPGGGQAAIVHLVTNYDDLKPQLETRAAEGAPVAGAQLQAPVRPGKILCMGGNFREFGAREPSPMWGFTKSLHAVLDPGGTVVLPDIDANIFHHEAELVLVFGKGGKDIPASEAMDHVFGYTAGVDVSARMPTPGGGRAPNTLPVAEHKSHPTFCPLGPCIVTKDEIANPEKLQVTLSVDGELARQLQHRRPRPLHRRVDRVRGRYRGDQPRRRALHGHQPPGPRRDAGRRHHRDGRRGRGQLHLLGERPAQAPLAQGRRRGVGKGRARGRRRPRPPGPAPAVPNSSPQANEGSDGDAAFSGTPDRTRTCNARVKSPALCH